MDASDVRKRIEICKACPFRVAGLIVRCEKCGCPLGAKVRIQRAQCPEGKW